MKIQVTVTRINHGIDEFKKRLEVQAMKKSYVKAGVMGGAHKPESHAHGTPRPAKAVPARNGSVTNAQLASIHEFGLGNVPARPFIRPPFAANRAAYLEILKAGYYQALVKGDTNAFRRTLGLVGAKMAADIKKYVTDGNNLAPLAQSTIDRKGSSRPLVDTGQLINSVTYEVIE